MTRKPITEPLKAGWKISVDPGIRSDPRFQNLILKIGDAEKAMGRLVNVWSIGCAYFREGKAIPSEYAKILGCDQLIECGLAIETEEGVVVKGSEEHFSWAKERRALAMRMAEVRWGKKETDASSIHEAYLKDASLMPPDALRVKSLEIELKSPLSPLGGECEVVHISDPEKKEKKRSEQMAKAVEVLEAWNEDSGALPKVETKKISKTRLGKINARLSEMPLEKLREIFKALSKWPWGLGENPSGWMANFDYAMKPDTLDNFNNGKFNGASKKTEEVKKRFKTMVGTDELGRPQYEYR